MTDEQNERYKKEMAVWRKVFEEDKKQQQAEEQKHRQEAIKRREEGKALPGDYAYFKENKKDTIAHQDEKIAHPDTMRKEPATILLIVGMFGSFIFKQWYLVCAMLLWWYFSKNRV